MKPRLIAGGFAVGIPGIIIVNLMIVPALLAGKSLPVPMWVAQLGSTLQGCIFLGIAVCIGAFLAPKVGLRAPVLMAWAERKPLGEAAKVVLVPGLAGGVLGAAVTLLSAMSAPPELKVENPIPALARVLYGGVTEELLMRWGFMTLVAWVLWRLFQRRAGKPSAVVIVSAIVAAGLMFGAAHLPAAALLVANLTPGVIVFIVAGNAAFSLIAGWLYWKAGLEAAIIAHITTHLGILLFTM
jgi:hypothetical protein